MGNSITICRQPREEDREGISGIKCQSAEDKEVSSCTVHRSFVPSIHNKPGEPCMFENAAVNSENEPGERTGICSGSSSGHGVTRVKIVVRKEEVHRLLWQLNGEGGTGRSLEDVLIRAMGRSRGDMKEYWTPSLGSIAEGSESYLTEGAA